MAFTVYSDLAAILLFPEHRPSALFTLLSPQCLPILLLSAVFQVTFLTLALLILCWSHMYMAVHVSFTPIIIVLLQSVHQQRVVAAEVSAQQQISFHTADQLLGPCFAPRYTTYNVTLLRETLLVTCEGELLSHRSQQYLQFNKQMQKTRFKLAFCNGFKIQFILICVSFNSATLVQVCLMGCNASGKIHLREAGSCFLCWHPGQTSGYASNDSASGACIPLQPELTGERATPSLSSLEAV